METLIVGTRGGGGVGSPNKMGGRREKGKGRII